MSARKQRVSIVVARDYRYEFEACEQAVAHLLKTNPTNNVNKKAAPASGPDLAEESKNYRTDTIIVHE